MITAKTMYALYTKELVDKTKSIDIEIESNKQVLKKLIKYFLSDMCDREIIKEDLEVKLIKPITIPYSNEEKYFNIQLDNYYKILAVYEEQVEQKKRLVAHKIKIKVYKYILLNFNRKLVQHLVFNKYKFSQYKLGGLLCHCGKNKNRPIDWVKSNINKEKLLKEGKKPYIKEEARIAQEQGLPYEGHEWVEYGNLYSFFFKWDISAHNFITMPNMKYFTFMPTKAKDSVNKELFKHRNTMTEEQAINFYNTEPNAH